MNKYEAYQLNQGQRTIKLRDYRSGDILSRDEAIDNIDRLPYAEGITRHGRLYWLRELVGHEHVYITPSNLLRIHSGSTL